MNSSFESDVNRTNLISKDILTEIDNKSINTNLSSLMLGSTKFLFKGNINDNKILSSANSLTNEFLKDVSSIGLTKMRKTEKIKINNKLININIEKYKDSWIDICSQNISKIILIKVVDQCYFEGHLHLKNNLDNEYILIKFINKRYYYTITPSILFIKPRNEIIINIKRFCKLAPDNSSNKANDSILMIAKKTENKIDDLNDAKIYLKPDDLYTDDYQLFSFSLVLDNGYNPIYYDKLVEDRKKMIETFYTKTNINEIKNINTMREHIENMKINIKEYRNKLMKLEKEFESILENVDKQNIIAKENYNEKQIHKIIVDKEEFYEVGEVNNKEVLGELNHNLIKTNIFHILHDENGVTIPMILFGLSIGLYIGRFIKFFLFK